MKISSVSPANDANADEKVLIRWHCSDYVQQNMLGRCVILPSSNNDLITHLPYHLRNRRPTAALPTALNALHEP
jgi:hypothetical protein